jgi:hypothetical protein
VEKTIRKLKFQLFKKSRWSGIPPFPATEQGKRSHQPLLGIVAAIVPLFGW